MRFTGFYLWRKKLWVFHVGIYTIHPFGARFREILRTAFFDGFSGPWKLTLRMNHPRWFIIPHFNLSPLFAGQPLNSTFWGMTKIYPPWKQRWDAKSLARTCRLCKRLWPPCASHKVNPLKTLSPRKFLSPSSLEKDTRTRTCNALRRTGTARSSPSPRPWGKGVSPSPSCFASSARFFKRTSMTSPLFQCKKQPWCTRAQANSHRIGISQPHAILSRSIRSDSTPLAPSVLNFLQFPETKPASKSTF